MKTQCCKQSSTTSRNGSRKLAVRLVTLTVLLTGGGFCQAQDSQSTTMSAPTVESRSPWQASVAVGVKLAEGNTDSPSFAAGLTGTRQWGSNTLELGADATVGSGANAIPNATLNGFIEYDRALTQRIYVFGRSDAERDLGAHLDYRFINSVGAGGRISLSDRLVFRFEGGPAAVTEKEAGDTATYATFRSAERLTFKLTNRLRLWQAAEFEPQLDHFENYLAKVVLGVEADLTRRVSLRVSVRDEYDNQPAPGGERNELKFVTAIAYKF